MDASGPDPTFNEGVKRTLTDLAAGHPIRVSGWEARRMIRRLRREAGCSRRLYRALWSRPGESFGPFESLSEPLQVALGDAVGREVQEQQFTVSDRLYGAVYGPVFRLGGELARLGKRIRGRGRRWRGLGRLLFLSGRGVAASCEWVGRGWLGLTRYAPFTRTSGLHALWRWAGVDPLLLGVGYVGRIPCDPRLSPVHRNPDLNAESCVFVGLDFLASNGEMVYLEANANPGLAKNRLKLYPQGDPLGFGLCRYARERGFVRVVFFPTSISSISRELESAWRTSFEGHGIELELRDDPHHRSAWRRSWKPLMDPRARDTLYVNSRALPSPLLTLIRQKGLLESEIERYNQQVPEGDRVRTPRAIRSPEDIVPPEPDSRFPNLIIKHSLRDMASDHTLYKTDRFPDGVGPPYVVFEYLPSDRMVKFEDGEQAEYGVNYRSYLLITVEGPRYMGAKKSVGHIPLPAALPAGPLADVRPYVINIQLAATQMAVTPAEEEALEPATLRVGRVIDAFLRRKHGVLAAPFAGV